MGGSLNFNANEKFVSQEGDGRPWPRPPWHLEQQVLSVREVTQPGLWSRTSSLPPVTEK